MTVRELTEGILLACVGGERRLSIDTEQIRSGLLTDVDKGVALGELYLLRLSLAAYAVQKFLIPEVQGEAREFFNRFVHESIANSQDEAILEDAGRMVDGMNRRYAQYLEAIQAPNPHGAAWNVGNLFATLCGQERNLNVVMVGAHAFGGALVSTREFLMKCKGMEGGQVITLSDEGTAPAT